jgi:hypothetical protein
VDDSDSREFFLKFRAQLEKTDPFIQTVLNAHLDVEAHLEEFLDEIFFHPEDVERARLRVYQKICIARAFVELGRDRPEWLVMLELNTIRNKVAHRSNRVGMTIELRKLRDTLQQFGSDVFKDDIKKASPTDLVVNAALVCSGYLLHLIDELKRLQGKEVSDEE